ncbi:MAG: biotin-dependent carboxyltransferase family protein [Bacteroidota bacterium]
MRKSTQLIVQKPGLLTLIQDLGRAGNQAFGVPVGGAMDRQSAALANTLVGNPLDAPVLEMTLLGPTFLLQEAATIAFTGGTIEAFADGVPIAPNQMHQLPAESKLRFGRVLKGCRSYLAIQGDWQVQKWLGSGSWHSKTTTPDSWIRKGQILSISSSYPIEQSIPISLPEMDLNYPFRFLEGPEYQLLTPQQVQQLWDTEFTVDPVSNRMGYRLSPNLTMDQVFTPMISSAVLPGTVQLTPSGQLIVLMADAQTTGGYPRIGVIHSEDLDRLGQVRPGGVLRIQPPKVLPLQRKDIL